MIFHAQLPIIFSRTGKSRNIGIGGPIGNTCTYHTRALRHIRPLLTVTAAKSIATSIVGARLDYCNSLLYGISECNLDRLQWVQNQLALVWDPLRRYQIPRGAHSSVAIYIHGGM